MAKTVLDSFPKMTIEYSNGIGYDTIEEADDLSEFEFDHGEKFVRWHPWGNERADDDMWAVTNLSWEYRVSWIRDRDNIPTKENHRRYTLLSRETFDEVEVSEADLKRGDWKLLEEADGEEAAYESGGDADQ